MRVQRIFVILTLLSSAGSVIFAAGQAQQEKGKTLTVGDFAVMLSAATGSGPAAGLQGAAEALARTGVPVHDPKATLSEGNLVAVLKYYGLAATSSRPDQAVTTGRAEAVLALVRGLCDHRGEDDEDDDHDHDKKRECHLPEGQSLEICLEADKRGECIRCCKELCGPGTGCPRFCREGQKPSESEPLP